MAQPETVINITDSTIRLSAAAEGRSEDNRSYSETTQQENPTGSNEDSVLEQYRIGVESAERFEDRLVTQNRFAMTILPILISVIGWLLNQQYPASNPPTSGIIVVGFVIPTSFFILYWYWIIRTMVNRSTLRWRIVQAMEQTHPILSENISRTEHANVGAFRGRVGLEIWSMLTAGLFLLYSLAIILIVTNDLSTAGITTLIVYVVFVVVIIVIESNLRGLPDNLIEVD